MATPDPATPHNWLGGLIFFFTTGGAAGVLINGWLNRRKTKAEADRTSAQAVKTLAEGQGIHITAEVNLSDAALRLVGGLREELDRVLASHKEEVRVLRAESIAALSAMREGYEKQISILRDAHSEQMQRMTQALDDSEADRILLKERCEHLEKRVNELASASPHNFVPLPEGGYGTFDEGA